MPRPTPMFSDDESAVLLALYEQPLGLLDPYGLVRELKPDVRSGTPQHKVALTGVFLAVENLILGDLVIGERVNGPDGVYFEKLKLTRKGEQAAIRERRRVAEFNKQLPEFIRRAEEVTGEMIEFEKKKKEKDRKR